MGSALASGIINTGFQLGGLISNSIATKKMGRKLDDLMGQDPNYAGSPYAKNMYGLAQNRLNSRMTGAGALERNLQASQANSVYNTNRMATDSSQALSLAAAAQAQTNAGFDQLRQQEAADYNTKYGMLNDASNAMTDEERFKYGEQVRRWQDQVNTLMTKYKMKRQNTNDWSQAGAALGGVSDSALNGLLGGGKGGGGGMDLSKIMSFVPFV